MNRRAFLKSGLALASGLPLATFARSHKETKSSTAVVGKFRRNGFAPLRIKRLRIDVGAEKPFRVFHVSDTHIVRVDATENDPRKVKLASERCVSMGFGEHYLDEAVHAAREEKALLMHTGDLVDFVSKANLRYAGLVYGSDDWFVAAGNHEFSQYVGEAREDAAYKAESWSRVQASSPNDLAFASRVVNGVNFVAVDDAYYSFTPEALKRMKQEVDKGLPIVFMCHVPLYTPRHYEHNLAQTKGVCAYLTGVPDRLVRTWSNQGPWAAGEEWRDRRIQQKTDDATRNFIDYLKSQTLVKAVLAGHCHEFWEERFSPTAVQFTCSATYRGQCSAIDFV